MVLETKYDVMTQKKGFLLPCILNFSQSGFSSRLERIAEENRFRSYGLTHHNPIGKDALDGVGDAQGVFSIFRDDYWFQAYRLV